MIVENAGFGAVAAAPIARRAIDYHLLGLWPSVEDMAATREGRSTAPMGTPRRAQDVAVAVATEAASQPAVASRSTTP
jgi:penicillin-binding protein 2